MTISLSENDRRMLDGAYGPAARTAMSVLVRMAEVYGTGELMDVSQAHIDGCGLMSDAGLEFAERLSADGGRVRVPTTLNMGPLDLQDWRRFVADEFSLDRALDSTLALYAELMENVREPAAAPER